MQELKFERYLFEIGIYSCNPDRFFTERKEHLQKHLEWITHQFGGITREQAPETFTSAETYFIKKYGGWRYTQAIGWIRLFVLGRQIRGEIWVVNAKRIDRKMNKRKFQHYGKAFELSFFPGEDSSTDIYNQVCNALDRITKERPFKGRYIDLEAFHNIGPFINWRGLVGLE